MGMGRMGVQVGRMGALGGRPGWVFTGALVDFDFVNGRYFGGSLDSILSCSRASTDTSLYPSSASGASYVTFANNQLDITSAGALVEEFRTNVLLNSTTPVTQTVAFLAIGTYTLWVNGAGSALASGGTATITGAASATNGSPNVFNVTVAGSVIVTKTGALNSFQLELGTFGTSLIVTAGASALRASDAVTFIGNAATALGAASGAIVFSCSGVPDPTNQTFPTLFGGNSNRAFLCQNGAGASTTLVGRDTNGSNPMTCTFGSGTTGSPFKAALSWSSSGRAMVANGGTVATAATSLQNITMANPSLGSAVNSNATYAFTFFKRLTIYPYTPANAALQALTI